MYCDTLAQSMSHAIETEKGRNISMECELRGCDSRNIAKRKIRTEFSIYVDFVVCIFGYMCSIWLSEAERKYHFLLFQFFRQSFNHLPELFR